MLGIIVTIGSIQVLAILVSLLRSKIVAVLLGPQGVGIISVIDQVVQLSATVSSFSVPLAATKFLSRAHSEGQDEFRNMYAALLKALLVLAAAGTAGTLLVAAAHVEAFGQDMVRFRPLLLVALAGIPAAVLGAFVPNVFASAQKVRASAMTAVATNSGLAVGGVCGILLAGLAGFYAGTVTVNSLVVVALLLYVAKSAGLGLSGQRTEKPRLWKLAREVGPVSMLFYIAAAAQSLSLLVARYAVLRTGGEAAAGLLQAAFSLSMSLALVLNPTNGLYLMPLMNRNTERREKIRTAFLYQRRLGGVLALLGMPMVLFPGALIGILYSARFTSAAAWLFLFVVAQILMQLAAVYATVLVGLDEMKWWAMLALGGHFLVGYLSWLLAPRYGIAAVGIALLSSGALTWTGGLAVLGWRHRVRMPAGLWCMTAYAVGTVLFAGLAFRGHQEFSLSGYLLKTGVYGLFLAGLALFLDGGERAWLVQRWRTLGRAAEEELVPSGRH